MNFKRCANSFALFAVALGGLALPAGAQGFKGSFTLPYEAVWGSTVLEPGNYTVAAEGFGGAPIFRIEGNGKTVNVLTGTTEVTEPNYGGKGRIEVSEINGTNVVTKFVSASIGREFTFAVPRSVRNGAFPGVALKKVAIPVTSAH